MMKSCSKYLVALLVILWMLSLGTESHALDKASISASGIPSCMTPGQTATATVTVTNQGDTSWSSNPAAAVAGCSNVDNCPVHLSYHLTGPVNVSNGLRTDISGTIDPQNSQTVTAQIKASDTYGTEAPLPTGTYTLSWQMVREHIGWIESMQSYTVEVKNSCAPALDKASISAPGTPKCMTPGQTVTADVTVLNQGNTSWSSSPAAAVAGCSNADNCPVHLSYHLTGPMNVANGLRTDISGTIDPQNSKTFTAQIKASDTYGTEAPLALGTYTLNWQMVREHIGWIETMQPYTVEVKQSCDQPPPGNPPLPIDYAKIVVWKMPSCMQPGETKTIQVQVTNGGRTWSSSPKTAVKGCTNPDKCPVRLSYRLTGPVKVEDGLRTNLPDMPKGDTQNVDAKLKVPLTEGTYTVNWQVVREHMDWFPDKTPLSIEVSKGCGAKGKIAELCKKVNCSKRIDVPHISSVSPSPFTQGNMLIITGRDFGDQPGSVTMTGAFMTNPGANFKIIATKAINLSLIGNTWHDNMIPVGISPNLVGLDQEVVIQVKAKAGKLSNEFKVAFNSQKDIKMVPRTAIDASGCSQVTNQQLPASRMTHCCNSSGDHACARYITNTVSAEHVGGSQPNLAFDSYRFNLHKGWNYHSMEGGYYWGTLTKFTPPASGGDCQFSVSWQPGHIGTDDYNHPIFGVGYWMNIYVEGPVGTEPW